MQNRLAIQLYLVNLALLFAHEIDSAYWQEWDLFGIPGGIQVFVVLNLLLLLAALWGFEQLVQGRPAGRVLSLVLAAGGIFAFTIHTYFILAGRPQFTLPVSIALLAAILIASLAQALVTLRAWRAQAA